MQITEKSIQALRILATYPNGIVAGIFAREMWPGRSGDKYNRSLNQTAGSYLAKLAKAGYVQCVYEDWGILYRLTKAGREAIKGAEEAADA